MKLKIYLMLIVFVMLISGCSQSAVSTPSAVDTAVSASPSALPSPSVSITPAPSTSSTATVEPQPKDLDKQIHDFLNKTGDYTEENISKKIIKDTKGKETKLGIVNFGDSFECWLFDYQKKDDYILLTVGFDGKDGNRFVTELAIPVYVYEKGNFSDYKLVFSKISDSIVVDGMQAAFSASSGQDMCGYFDKLKDSPIIVYSTVDKYKGSLDSYNDEAKKYIKEYNDKRKLVKELFYEIAGNGLKPDFDQPGDVTLIKITGKSDLDNIDTTQVPIVLNDIWY